MLTSAADLAQRSMLTAKPNKTDAWHFKPLPSSALTMRPVLRAAIAVALGVSGSCCTFMLTCKLVTDAGAKVLVHVTNYMGEQLLHRADDEPMMSRCGMVGLEYRYISQMGLS